MSAKPTLILDRENMCTILKDIELTGIMKKIEALVPSDKLREVKEAIKKAGAGGLMVLTGKGQGKGQRPEVTGGRGTKIHVAEYNAIESVMTVVDDSVVDVIVSAITDAASTASKGDGKIFISSIDEAVDIGSKQKGTQAL